MARPVDEKIARMKLENSDFKVKVQETIGFFSKLNDKINKVPNANLDKTVKDMAKLGQETSNVPMNKLLDMVGSLSNRFSTLGIIGMTALQNITNRAMDLGTKITRALTVEGAQAGFQEYELKMNSIQTMLSNTQGKSSLQDVKDVLGELNDYADKTIYSFADMTSNIGRFTAAGVGLEDSATAIKGISNLAAVSGSNANQASNAMYQLSQELASGRVTLMGWNSVVNAGMGGKVFQDALTKTADNLGIARDKTKSFRDSLQDGWLTSEVLLSTLKEFSTDESMLEAATKVRTFTQLIDTTKEAIGSGWATSWELIVGDFEEASAMWSKVGDFISGVVSDSAKARNGMIKGLIDMGGKQNILDGFVNILKTMGSVFESVRDGFRMAFPKKSVVELTEMTRKFLEFTEKLKVSDETGRKLKTVFHGIFSIFSSGLIIAKKIGSAFANIIPKGAGGGILDFSVKIAELLISFNKALEAGNVLTKGIEKLGEVFGYISDKISGVGGKKKNPFDFGDSIDKLLDRLSKLKDIILKLTKPYREFIMGLGFKDLLGAGAIGGGLIISTKIGELLDSFKGITKSPGKILDSIKKMFGSAGGAFDKLGDSLNAFTNKMKYDSLLKIAIAIGVLAVSLKILEGINAEDLGKGLVTMGIALAGLTIGFKAMSKMNLKGFSGTKTAILLVALAISVGMIAMAIKKFGDVETTTVTRGLLAVAGIVAILVGSLKLLSGAMATAKMFSGANMAITLMAITTSVLALSFAMVKLGQVDPKILQTGGIALATLMTVLVGAFSVITKLKPPSLKTMLGFLAFTAGLQIAAVSVAIFGGALHIIIGAIEKIGNLKPEVLKQGLIGIASSLLAIGVALKLTKGTFSGALGVLVVVGAMNLLMPVIESFGKMNIKTLTKSMIAVAASLGILVLSLRLAKGTLGAAVALTVAAGALTLLAVPIAALSKLSLKQVGTALLAIGGALLVVGGAAYILTPVIGSMLAMGVAFTLISGAVLIAGVGLGLLGTGLAVFAASVAASVGSILLGFGLFLDGLTELIPKVGVLIVEFATMLITTLATVIVKNGPSLMIAAGTLILILLKGLDMYVPKILEVGMSIVMKLIMGIVEYLPQLISAAVLVIVAFISGISDAIRVHGPTLIREVLKLVGEIIVIIVEAFFAVMDALFGWIPGVTKVLNKGADAASEAIRDRFDGETLGEDISNDVNKGLKKSVPEYKKSGKLVGDTLKEGLESVDMKSGGQIQSDGFIKGVESKKKGVFGAGLGLVGELDTATMMADLFPNGKSSGESFADGIESTEINTMLASAGLTGMFEDTLGKTDANNIGKEEATEYADGIKSKAGDAKKSANDVAIGANTGLKNTDTFSSGTYFVGGFINGINSKKTSAQAAARDLGNTASKHLKNVLMERSPSKVTAEIGEYFGEGFINGVLAMRSKTTNAVSMLSNKAVEALKKFVQTFSDELETEKEYELAFKPVIDLDDFNPDDVPGGKFGLDPKLSYVGANMEALGTTYSKASDEPNKSQNGDKKKEQKTEIKEVKVTNDVNITITGADGLMQDQDFVRKLKTVILNEVSTGNRTIPNRTSLIPL